MNDTEAFLRKIRENPDDDAPRLVFADYLDEQAQKSSNKEAKEQAKWAALIRAGIARERETVADASLWNKWAGVDSSVRFKPAQLLLPKNCRGYARVWLTRGFYDCLDASATWIAENSEELLESLAPIQKLVVSLLNEEWNNIAENPLLNLIRTVDLSQNYKLSKVDLRAICNDSQLRELTELNFSIWNDEEGDSLGVFKDCQNFPSLKRLSVAYREINDFRELLKYPITTNLESLTGNVISVPCAELYSQAPLAKTLTRMVINDLKEYPTKKPKWGELQNLKQLDLTANSSKDWVTHFLESQNLIHIKKLELRGKGIPKNVLCYFDNGEEELELELYDLSRPQLKEILNSPAMGRVKKLLVYGNNTEYVVELLSKNEAITNLRSLDLNTYEGIKKPIPLFNTLSTSPIFANLLHFETNAPISFVALKQIAGSGMGQSLRALICDSPQLAAKWQEFLRDPKNFPNLVHFSLHMLDLDDNLIANGRKKLKLV